MWDAAELPEVGWVLEIAWPKRALFWCEDPASAWNGPSGAWVWADHAGDAVEAMAEINDHEGDDDNVTCREATGEEWERVLAASEAWLAKL